MGGVLRGERRAKRRGGMRGEREERGETGRGITTWIVSYSSVSGMRQPSHVAVDGRSSCSRFHWWRVERKTMPRTTAETMSAVSSARVALRTQSSMCACRLHMCLVFLSSISSSSESCTSLSSLRYQRRSSACICPHRNVCSCARAARSWSTTPSPAHASPRKGLPTMVSCVPVSYANSIET